MVAPTSTMTTPVITDSPQRLVIYQHHTVAEADLPKAIGGSFTALYGRAAEAGVLPAGPPFAIYYEGSEPGVHWDVDVCVPIATPMTPTAEILFKEMPPCAVVSATHIGPYTELGRTYEAIKAYIRDKGLNIAGPPREYYMSPPEVPPEQVNTLVEFPII